jgi:hypothetical protein
LANRIRDLSVFEISSVDKGANNGLSRVMLTKRDQQQETKMPELETVKKFLSETSDVAAIEKADAFMTADNWLDVLNKRATANQKAGESFHQAFARAALDPVGKIILDLQVRKGHTAPVPDKGDGKLHHPDGTLMSDNDGDEETPESAYKKITAQGEAHRKEFLAKNPKARMTPEQGFAHALTRPENRALSVKANLYRPTSQGVHGIGIASPYRPDLSRR